MMNGKAACFQQAALQLRILIGALTPRFRHGPTAPVLPYGAVAAPCVLCAFTGHYGVSNTSGCFFERTIECNNSNRIFLRFNTV